VWEQTETVASGLQQINRFGISPLISVYNRVKMDTAGSGFTHLLLRRADATSIRCREASFNGADGVVAHKSRFGMRFATWLVSPVFRLRAIALALRARLRGIGWLRDFFVERAATPPQEEGNKDTLSNSGEVFEELVNRHSEEV
jgi:hypothetical protein